MAGQRLDFFQDETLQNGEKRHLDVTCIPLLGEDQKLESWLMLISDATHWKDLELRLQELALTDELTKLRNRRYLLEAGATEIARAQRFSRSLSLVMLDIDHFKRINDEFGHAMGDSTLQAFANILKQHCRASDVVARTGGEEFVILLPETSLEEAGEYAESLRKNVQAASIVTPRNVMRITISLGVSSLNDRCSNLDELMKCADRALYHAKSRGRNCVEICDDDNITV
jgi:diguanylate cyclase (GGDEF)-like protein